MLHLGVCLAFFHFVGRLEFIDVFIVTHTLREMNQGWQSGPSESVVTLRSCFCRVLTSNWKLVLVVPHKVSLLSFKRHKTLS